MWKCPKCGRTFKKENQGHYCGEAPKTIDEYINAQDEEFRSQLYAVREALKKSLPDAAEKIAWSMPTYWQGGNIIHFAANKKGPRIPLQTVFQGPVPGVYAEKLFHQKNPVDIFCSSFNSHGIKKEANSP